MYEISNNRLEGHLIILENSINRLEDKLVIILILMFLWNVFVTFALLCKLFGWII